MNMKMNKGKYEKQHENEHLNEQGIAREAA